MHSWILALLVTLSFCPCYASLEEDPSPLANFESEPSSFVGKVNVITGAYQEFSQDLVIAGPEPLVIQRAYCSMSVEEGSLLNGWSLNHGGLIYLDEDSGSQLLVKGAFGCPLLFITEDSHKAKKQAFTLDLDIMLDGLTNCADGRISGRTNKKNASLTLDHKRKKCHLLTGSGSQSHFVPCKDDSKAQYCLEVEQKPNGNQIVYEYDRHNRLKKIETKNRLGKTFAWAKIEYPSEKELAKDPKIHIKASDGRQISYHFLKVDNTGPYKNQSYYFIDKVTCQDKPTERYRYETKTKKAKETICQKIDPDNRFLKTEYYDKGSQKAGKKWVKVARDDAIFRRVKKQLAPVGTDSTPITVRSFIYEVEKGYTEVYDAYKRKTLYHYNDNSVLTSIEQVVTKPWPFFNHPLLVTEVPYRCENFYWGKGHRTKGYLVSRTISGYGPNELKKGILLCKAYQYDKKGNVKCESLWGNLTGVKPKPIILDPHKDFEPHHNGCHHHDIYYEYSSDDFNLLLKETHPNGKVIVYTYYPNSDLLKSKLTRDGQSIILREFYDYDENAVLCCTTRDDGKASEKDDLQGATQRYITRIYPKQKKPCLGLPERVEEQCVDLATKQIITLKATHNTYDDFGHLIEQRHYDSQGNLAYTLYWQYDAHGHVTLEKNALGHTIERTYDANGNIASERGPRPDSCKIFYYDFANRLIREEEGDGQGNSLSKTYRYDYVGNRVGSTDCHGNETSYIYDDFNQLTQVIFPSVLKEDNTAINPTVTYAYNILGQRVATTDAKEQTIYKDYNVRGQPTAIYYPDGTKELFEYDTAGNLVKSIDKKELTTIYEYDVLDRAVKTSFYAKDQLLCQKASIYSTFHLLQEIDELGHVTYYSYDYAGRLISKQAGNSLITYQYDSLGRQSLTQEWSNAYEYLNKTQIYNALNQLVEEKVVDHLGVLHHRIGYEYLSDGQKTATTTYGEMGACTTRTSYNLQKEPLVTTDAEGNQTINVYNYRFQNALGQFVLQKTQTDPLGNQIQTTYDALNREVSTLYKNAWGEALKKKEILYDACGNKVHIKETSLASYLPPRETKTSISYDCMGRIERLSEGASTPQEKWTVYSYNAFGQKQAVLKPDGCTIFYTYDSFGRLDTFKASDDSFSYRYEYNAKGMPTRVYDLKNKQVTQRVYNENDKMAQEILQNGLSISYEYDHMGRPLSIYLPDSSGISYSYQGPYLHRISRVNSLNQLAYQHFYQQRDLSGNPLEEKLAKEAGLYCHRYDRLGQLKESLADQWQETNCHYNGAGSLVQRQLKDSKGEASYSYAYDALNQLKEEKGDISHQYVYDCTYNRLAKDGTLYEVNELNELLAQGDVRYLYDRCGNCIQKNQGSTVTGYAYDALDRLIAVTQNGKEVVRYFYDAFNRRISKQIEEKLISYLYTEQNEIGSFESGVAQEIRILGTGKGAEIGAAIAIEIKNEIYIPLHDHNGNVSCLLDIRGKVIETYRYSAYGEEQIYNEEGFLLETSINPWRFSSKRFDQETGWIYFGRRYYDREAGRWMTPDPLGQEGGPNLYTYALNNPLTRIDLYGLFDFGGFLSSLFCQICSYMGSLMSMIGYECVPIPVVKDAVTAPGHILQHGNLNEFVPSYSETHSRNDKIGVWRDSKHADVFVNGIRTTKDEVEDRYGKASSLCNGNIFYFTYNATHGLVADLLEWVGQRVGIPTNSVSKLVTNIRERIDDLGGVNGGGMVHLKAHSQGGQIVASLRQHLTKEEMGMIDVKTYGTANIFSTGDFASVTHYISTRDWVPLSASPIQYMRACLGDMPEVTFLQAIDSPFFDHSFEGKTYQTQFQKDMAGVK